MNYDVLARGPYGAGAVQTEFVDRERPSSAAWDASIEALWSARIEEARASGRELFDGHVLRLDSYQLTPDSLHLRVGPCRYREFVGTNLGQPERLGEVDWSWFANPVGTIELSATVQPVQLTGVGSPPV